MGNTSPTRHSLLLANQTGRCCADLHQSWSLLPIWSNSVLYPARGRGSVLSTVQGVFTMPRPLPLLPYLTGWDKFSGGFLDLPTHSQLACSLSTCPLTLNWPAHSYLACLLSTRPLTLDLPTHSQPTCLLTLDSPAHPQLTHSLSTCPLTLDSPAHSQLAHSFLTCPLTFISLTHSRLVIPKITLCLWSHFLF